MPRRAKPPAAVDPLDCVRELASLLDEYGLSAVTASWGGVRVRLERTPPTLGPAPAVPGGPLAVPSAPSPAPEAGLGPASTHLSIEAPMVGTFYRAPSPGAEPYVNEGDTIKQGQTLCIIEAMKLMNEIEAKVDGRVVKILAENGQAVEFGQPLFHIEPLR
jgi:acetyl-CoA carboxylase biotin carboxyl carrier protein